MTKETPPIEAADTDPRRADHGPEALDTLRRAMRRARFDDAERVGVLAELRATQIGRLEILQDALKPLLDQLPRDAAELFDIGLMPGATPRLFIDMIGFVEMGRDAKLYRLVQDTRYRRITLAETSDTATMVSAVTDYVARRLVERDKALAADTGEAAQPTRTRPKRPRRSPVRRVFGWFGAAFEFVIFLLGAIAFFGLIAAAGYYAYVRWQGQI